MITAVEIIDKNLRRLVKVIATTGLGGAYGTSQVVWSSKSFSNVVQ